jgi:hypothetical protein
MAVPLAGAVAGVIRVGGDQPDGVGHLSEAIQLVIHLVVTFRFGAVTVLTLLTGS